LFDVCGYEELKIDKEVVGRDMNLFANNLR